MLKIKFTDMLALRDDRRLKNGCFFGKVPKGGGGGEERIISDPKNYIADFVGFAIMFTSLHHS